MKVWVLTIDDKSGTDVSVHLSRAEADAANFNYCDRSWSEHFSEERPPADRLVRTYWEGQSLRGEDWHRIDECETKGDTSVPPIFVPTNPHGVKPGYYTRPDIVRLLRMHKMFPERVQFIADMME